MAGRRDAERRPLERSISPFEAIASSPAAIEDLSRNRAC
jgi:hypothetical protein